MTILIKAIKPKRKWYPEAFIIEIKKAGDREAKIIEGMYKNTVATWKDKPRFVRDVQVKLNKVSIVVRPDARYNASKVFGYLDLGTKTRWALMSSDFAPKTRVRVIGSRQGSGKVVLRGRSAMLARGIGARRGITARKFSNEIAKRRRKYWHSNMNKAMAKAARQVWK